MVKLLKNKSSIFQKDEISTRNFYLQLFRTYCELPFHETMQSFAKVFNDVFVKEKPQVCQKYFLTEVNILELDLRDKYSHEVYQAFRWNFADGSSKEVNYLASPYLRAFLLSTLQSIKSKEGVEITNFSPKRRNENDFISTRSIQKFFLPTNGREFFLSNILMKVYQVPPLFIRSSEAEYSDSEASFIVVFYEKQIRKRTWAKTAAQINRAKRFQEIQRACADRGIQQVLEDLMLNRDSKMRRFCNYFLTLFNQQKLNPFT
jgi:hypothetical protein